MLAYRGKTDGGDGLGLEPARVARGRTLDLFLRRDTRIKSRSMTPKRGLQSCGAHQTPQLLDLPRTFAILEHNHDQRRYKRGIYVAAQGSSTCSKDNQSEAYGCGQATKALHLYLTQHLPSISWLSDD